MFVLTLSDYIEDYIKKLLSMTAHQYVELQRSELADKFKCVPSQINYVLSTRFTPERGYLVQSRRGGKGYIRIMKIEPLYHKFWKEYQKELEDSQLDSGEENCSHELKRIQGVIKRLYEDRLITRREAEIIASVMREDMFDDLKIEYRYKKELFRNMFNHMLTALFKEI